MSNQGLESATKSAIETSVREPNEGNSIPKARVGRFGALVSWVWIVGVAFKALGFNGRVGVGNVGVIEGG